MGRWDFVKNMSDDEIRFVREEIEHKVSEIEFYWEFEKNISKKIPEEEIPEEIKKYDRNVYRYHEDDAPGYVKISAKSVIRGDLEIRSFYYDTEHLRDPDHMVRDYGCTGSFNEDRVYYKGKEFYRTDNVCSCHSDGPSVKLNKKDGFERIQLFNINDEFVNKINVEYNIITKNKKIKELEGKTGMSRKEISDLLNE